MNAMEDAASKTFGISKPNSSRQAEDKAHIRDTDTTLIEEDRDTNSEYEEEVEEKEVAENQPCKNCQHKRCVLDRRIAGVVTAVVKETKRVTKAANQLTDAIEEGVSNVSCGMKVMETELCAVNAAVVNLQAKVNSANSAQSWLESDIDALRIEIQWPDHNSTIQTVTTQRKRKITDEGNPAPENMVNGGGRLGRGHGRKLSKINNGLSSRHATPSARDSAQE